MTGPFFYIADLKKLSINACTIKNFWQSLQCHHDIPSKLPKNILSFYFQSFFCSLSVQATWFAGNKYLTYETIISVPVIDSSLMDYPVFV